jgi:hypothetical protein
LLENPSILLIPNLPRDQQGDGSHSLAVRHAPARHHVPPIGDVKVHPLRRLKLVESHPFFDKAQKAGGDAIMIKEIFDGLCALLAKEGKSHN